MNTSFSFLTIDYHLLLESMPLLLRGAAVSLMLAVGALCIGFLGGLFVALGLSSRSRIIRLVLQGYTTVIRGTPMLIQLFFMYYILSNAWHLRPFWCALIAIGMNSSAYVGHIIKAGIMSVSQGQLEAAAVLGIDKWAFLTKILLPQAIVQVLPALINEGITLIKDTSLASLLGVVELYQSGKDIITVTYDSVTIYIALAAFYLTMTVTLSYIVKILERSLVFHVDYYES